MSPVRSLICAFLGLMSVERYFLYVLLLLLCFLCVWFYFRFPWFDVRLALISLCGVLISLFSFRFPGPCPVSEGDSESPQWDLSRF